MLKNNPRRPIWFGYVEDTFTLPLSKNTATKRMILYIFNTVQPLLKGHPRGMYRGRLKGVGRLIEVTTGL